MSEQPEIVHVSSRMAPEQRTGLRLAGAKAGLSMSAVIEAIGAAGEAQDTRLDELLADYAAPFRRSPGIKPGSKRKTGA